MKSSIKLLIIITITVFFLLYLKTTVDNTIIKVKNNFEKTEIVELETLSLNISKAITDEVKNGTIFNTLKENKNLQHQLQRSLKIILGKKNKYAYILHLDDSEHFRILIDGSNDETYFFNEPFTVTNEKWIEIYKSGKFDYFKEESLTSIWMTYAYPIINNGKVEALFVIDFSREEIIKTLDYFKPLQDLLGNVLLFILFGTIGFFMLLWLWNMKYKKAKETLKENQQFFEKILNSQSSIVVTLQENKITIANSAFYKFFEIKSLSEFTQKYTDFVSQMQLIDKANISLQERFDNLDNNAYFKVKINESIFTVYAQKLFLDTNKVIVVTLTNISELEKATQKAELSNIAKSEFLASMSHEIRTPMNAIIGLTDLILSSSLSTKQHDYLSKIQLSSNSLLCIINDILDFSKIESGKMYLETKSFLLDDVIKKVKNIFENQKEYKHIRFNVFTDLDVPKCVESDMLRLEQVLINLLGNAFKFTPNGSVTLHISTLKDEKYNIKFEVIDTGIGINENKIQSLFDPFTQVDTSTTRKYGGTGLGLSISKKIINLMNGEIHVASKENEGTTFTVLLPLERCDVSTLAHLSSDIADIENLYKYKNISILIAEDNLINQDVIKGYLEKFDFDITIANDGLEVLEKCQQNKYDLIFMDINMPNMSGYEATQKLRKKNTMIPIIALSANARGEDFKNSFQIGMNDHVAKPIEPNILFKTLLKYLPEEKYEPDYEKVKLLIENDSNKMKQYMFKTLKYQDLLYDLSNNNTLCYKILEQFYLEYSQYEDDKNELENNIPQLKEYFHKLKGISGSIKAQKLFLLVENYYDILQDNKNNKELLSSIFTEMKDVIIEIKEFIELNKIENKYTSLENHTNDGKEKEYIFLNIVQSLETKKSKIIKKAINDINGTKLDKFETDIIQEVQKHIALYDFENALESMQKIYKDTDTDNKEEK